MDDEIVDIPELEGRTIVKASEWAGISDTLSLVLDDGSILQISAHVIGDSGDAEIQWQIEVAS